MGRVILIALILIVLYVAFRYFKVSVSNSALRDEENKYLADSTSEEPGENNDEEDEPNTDQSPSEH